ncbi:MAG: hypothetical protein KDH16_18905 [Rhodocyclaceae bacterium]|nr:hypothetical protein [Rhodocyclaceae bacterium]
MPPFDGAPSIFVATFGEIATVTPYGQSPRQIMAIFRNRPDLTLEISQPKPIMHARSTDAEDLRDGDAVIIAGASYEVRLVTPNGRGMTEIELELAAS